MSQGLTPAQPADASRLDAVQPRIADRLECPGPCSDLREALGVLAARMPEEGLEPPTLVGDRSHHRITIDPAAYDAAAIRCHENAGFKRVGVLEPGWRDPASRCWADVLLMELVRRPAC